MGPKGVIPNYLFYDFRKLVHSPYYKVTWPATKFLSPPVRRSVRLNIIPTDNLSRNQIKNVEEKKKILKFNDDFWSETIL